MSTLISLGAQPDHARPNNGFTALMAAAAAMHENTASALLRQGATVDLVDHNGASALMHAARHGAEGVARTILMGGAAIGLARAVSARRDAP